MAQSNGLYRGNRAQNTEISYEIKEHLGDLSAPNKSGWKREVNLVSWNDSEPKVDVRAWSSDHSRMGKGITLTTEEFMTLREIELSQLAAKQTVTNSAEYNESLEGLDTYEPSF